MERADGDAALPGQLPGLPGHNWSNAIAMATPIAHKGVIAGAKVQAMTVLDLLTAARAGDAGEGLLHERPDEGPQVHRRSSATTRPPATHLNAGDHAEVPAEQMQKYYYDPTKYKTYLEQLGITYPTVRPAPQKTTASGAQ